MTLGKIRRQAVPLLVPRFGPGNPAMVVGGRRREPPAPMFLPWFGRASWFLQGPWGPLEVFSGPIISHATSLDRVVK